jgi:hypothetical protein
MRGSGGAGEGPPKGPCVLRGPFVKVLNAEI